MKVRKMCKNGTMCLWKPGCRYIHPEDGEVMPQREQGFLLPDITKPPPEYKLKSSQDFPGLERVRGRQREAGASLEAGASREAGDSLEADRSQILAGVRPREAGASLEVERIQIQAGLNN